MCIRDRFLPTTIKEVRERGWDQLDVILFSGDAYIDHPAFGAAVVGRLLEAEGYRVAIVPQPNWRDDLRDFRKLGAPRLFFGISGGSMDSMVNHYTANLRLRHDDAYTPGGKAGFRPDRAVTVYSQILKRLYPHVPVVIGGIEASLRRLTQDVYKRQTANCSARNASRCCSRATATRRPPSCNAWMPRTPYCWAKPYSRPTRCSCSMSTGPEKRGSTPTRGPYSPTDGCASW